MEKRKKEEVRSETGRRRRRQEKPRRGKERRGRRASGPPGGPPDWRQNVRVGGIAPSVRRVFTRTRGRSLRQRWLMHRTQEEPAKC